MIKAIVLDVDGVIVGTQVGINFPFPHKSVIKVLKSIRESGIYVSLLTGKPVFGIEKIINDAHLNNLHITDGGALGIDPIDNQISFQYLIDKNLTRDLAEFYFKNNIYMEFVSTDEYYTLKDQINEFTEKRIKVLERSPVPMNDVESIINKANYAKIILFTKGEEQTSFAKQKFNEKFAKNLSLNWTINPYLLPYNLGIVTVKGVTKRKGVENISKYLNVPLENMLGIGDTMHDWGFIEICGYGATLNNADQKLKNLILKMDHGYIGTSVNENGVIDILKHFGLV